MKVTVVPKRPIPAILPKNKWIDSKMELDLNKNEIKHCMQYGDVYNEDGVLMDELNIKKVSDEFLTEVAKVVLGEKSIPDMGYLDGSTIIKTSDLKLEDLPRVTAEDFKAVTVEEFNHIVDPIINEEKLENVEDEEELETIYYALKPHYSKEDNYIILEVEMETNSKLEGNLYGLFSIISGPKPVPFEYKTETGWVKFNNKFTNFDKLENGDKLIFRLTPKNENEFTYRILIREGSTDLVKLEEKVNPSEL